MSAGPDEMERIFAGIEMVGRTGATEFELGFLEDDPPPDVANWYASATFRSAQVTTLPKLTPLEAIDSLVAVLTDGASCAWCGRPIAWGERRGPDSCWWREVGGRWERGCPTEDTGPLITEPPL